MWASETMDGQRKPLYGNIYAQVLSNWTFFAQIYPTAREVDAGIALKKSTLSLEYLNASPLMILRIRMHLVQSS